MLSADGVIKLIVPISLSKKGHDYCASCICDRAQSVTRGVSLRGVKSSEIWFTN